METEDEIRAGEITRQRNLEEDQAKKLYSANRQERIRDMVATNAKIFASKK